MTRSPAARQSTLLIWKSLWTFERLRRTLLYCQKQLISGNRFSAIRNGDENDRIAPRLFGPNDEPIRIVSGVNERSLVSKMIAAIVINELIVVRVWRLLCAILA